MCIYSTYFYIPSTFWEYLGLYPVTYCFSSGIPQMMDPLVPYPAPGTTFGSRRSRTGKCPMVQHIRTQDMWLFGHAVHHALRDRKISWHILQSSKDSKFAGSMRHFNRWFVPRHWFFKLRFTQQLAIFKNRKHKVGANHLDPTTQDMRCTWATPVRGAIAWPWL